MKKEEIIDSYIKNLSQEQADNIIKNINLHDFVFNTCDDDYSLKPHELSDIIDNKFLRLKKFRETFHVNIVKFLDMIMNTEHFERYFKRSKNLELILK